MNARRGDILMALRTASETGVSGEVLAHDLGISRAAVAKHVTALRDLGYVISAQPGSGYVLESAPDLPLAEEVIPLLRSGFWTRLDGHVETGSTNDDCKALAREGVAEGAVVLAARQNAGRGRLGRSWHSPAGGVYISLLLRPQAPLAELAALPLVISIGVARGLDGLGARASLKWPNDVWLGEGKVAGVLLETSAESDRAEWVVAGVGVNVHRDGGFDGAAYLDDALPADGSSAGHGLAKVAAAVLDGVADAYAVFARESFEDLVPEYESRSLLNGRDVVVRDLAGATLARGRARGIDRSGRLRVEQDGTVVSVSAGDVTLKGSDE